MIRSTFRRLLCASCAACAAAAALATASRAGAQQVQSHWLSPSSGDWTVPANWSTNPFFPDNGQPTPTTTYLARIAASGAPFEVQLRAGAVSPAGITVDGLILDSADATVRLTTSAGTAFRATQFVRLDAGTFIVDGGTLRATRVERTGGQLIGRSGELDAVTLAADMTVPNNTSFGQTPALTVRNGLTFDDAAVTLVRGESSTLGTGLRFDGTQTIGGSGTILLTGPTGTGTSGDPFVSFNNGTVTLGSGVTLRGGAIVSGGGGTFVNEGTVIADDPNRILYFWNVSSNAIVNRGLMEARNGTRIQIERPFVNEGVFRADGGSFAFGMTSYKTTDLGTLEALNGGYFVIGGVVDNADTTFTADDTTGDMLLAAVITGGTLSSAGSASHWVGGATTLNNATVSGRMVVAPAPGASSHRLVVNDVTLDGATISMGNSVGGGNLSSAGNSTLGGTGSLLLGAATESNWISANGGATLTLGPGVTVRATDGGGTIGSAGGTILHRGAILADSTTNRRLWLQRVVNDGSITVTNSSRLLASDLTNRGQLHVSGTSATFSGSWTNASGQVSVTGGASIELHSAPAALGSWSVADSSLWIGAMLPIPGAGATLTTAQVDQMSLNNATIVLGRGGVIDNAAQTLNLDGHALLFNFGTLSGGSLTRAGSERAAVAAGRDGTIDGVTIAVPLAVERGGRLFSTGDIVLNNGQLVIESPSPAGSRSIVYFNYTGPAAVTGAGEIRFTGGGTHGFVAMPLGGLTIGQDVTARADGGNGSFGDPINPSGPLVNQGAILSQAPGNYIRVDGTFTNEGVVRVTGGGSFAAERGFTNNGTFVVGADTAARVTRFGLHNNGTVSIDGTLLAGYWSEPNATLTQLLPQLVSGYANGAWDGPGINSPAAAANAGYGVGIADAYELFTSFPATFHGERVDPATVLLHYTRLGDADLDGAVGLADFNRLAAHFGESGAHWARGDFNYDGEVNLQDFNLLAGNFGLQASGPDVTTQDWSNLAAAVPEPGAAGAVAALSALILPHRHRRRRQRVARGEARERPALVRAAVADPAARNTR